MTKNNCLFWLAPILVLGIILRLLALSQFPPSLNWDEVSLGYNAYSLLHTGRDEWNVAFPVIFRAFGDYKLPAYIYSAVPTVAVFGLNPVGVRLPSVIAGVGLIFTGFLVAWQIFRDKKMALISAFLVATQPWTLFLSRVAVEANLAAFLISLGVYLGLTRRYLLASIFLGLSVWTYNSARFFVPALIIFALVYFRSQFKHLIFPLLVSAVFIIPMAFQLLQPSGQARLGWLTLLDSGAIAQIASLRANSHFPVPRLIYNKFTYFSVRFLSNYLSYFSPDFLFINGGSHYQFNIPHYGLLAPVNFVFFYLGLVFLLFSKSSRTRFLLLWLLLAPVAGSITRDSPHTLRAVTFLPLPMLITAFGLVTVVTRLSKKSVLIKSFLLVGFSLAVLIYLGQFVYLYTQSYPTAYSWSWQYGYPQVISYIKSNYSQYDEIIFTKKYGEPHEFVLFNWPWNPLAYSADPKLVRYFRSDWYWVDGFAKFRFVNDWEMPAFVNSLTAPGRYLIISGPDNPVSQDLLLQINFLDQKPAFYISQKTI